jgi:hypothetical protein
MVHRGGLSECFLGVLTPELEFLSAPKLKRGRRFDLLYERNAATGIEVRTLEKAGSTG